MKDLSIEKIGKEWQSLSWANGWTSESIEQKIYDECKEAMVSYSVDSSD